MAASVKRLSGFIHENWLLIAFLSLVIMGFLTLRTPATPIASEQELREMLSSGQPVLLEFYSNT
ncbi:MAG: hypothetical protein NUW24_09440 [Anaerolineae bacterium]|nr:hypothetical protein [Anaerolineae bacterium]MDH7474773.1 hypothetical protein [Anaerolineae bacterium]